MKFSRASIFESKKRSRAFIILFALIALAYIITPYWTLFGSTATKVIAFLLTVSICGVWAFFSSGAWDFSIRFTRASVVGFVILFVSLLAINLLPLASSIPWKGDEDYNIRITLTAAQMLNFKLLLPLLAATALLVFLAFKRPLWALVLLAIGFAGVLVYYLNVVLDEKYVSAILRYPFFSRWFHALPPALAGLFNLQFNEFLYRIIPFLCAVGIALFFATRLTGLPVWLRLVYGFTAGSMPLIYYYSSILYLEMPAVLLMLPVFFSIDDVVRTDWADLKTKFPWYCLVLIGLIKETVIPVLFCVCVMRLILFFKAHGRSAFRLTLLLREAGFYFCVLFPLAFYLLNRMVFGVDRTFSPHPGNLIDPAAYRAFFYSLWEQFGLFCVTALAGLVVMFARKKYVRFFFYAGVLASVPLFHILDNPALAGYSRFNLFLVPVFLLSSVEFLSLFAGKRKMFVLLPAAAALLAANVILSPVNLDGTKKPGWGNTMRDDSEQYYPYPQALAWIKENQNHKKILFLNLTYYYYFDFYFDKLKWKPDYEISREPLAGGQTALADALASAKARGYGVVVYRLAENDSGAEVQKNTGYRTRIVGNEAHRLLIVVL